MPTPQWSVRRASADDRDLIFDMNRATMREYVEAVWGWDETWQRRHFDEHFDPDENVQIIESAGQDVGMTNAVERPRDVLLVNIRVLPEWQCQGIGSSVVRSVIERADAARKPVTLKVLRVNTRAQQLYRRLGFAVDREEEHHLWMKRELDATATVEARGG
jgi:ribosomal protein S18 acetylase RimI-like enzyme